MARPIGLRPHTFEHFHIRGPKRRAGRCLVEEVPEDGLEDWMTAGGDATAHP